MLSIQRYFVFKYKQAYIEDDDDFKVLSTSQFEAHLKMAPLVIFRAVKRLKYLIVINRINVIVNYY